MVSSPKTTCRARFSLSVPMNMYRVKRPQKTKNQARAVSLAAAAAPAPLKMVGKTQMPPRVSQKKPYDVKANVPKVLFFLHSMTPAIIWATPP